MEKFVFSSVKLVQEPHRDVWWSCAVCKFSALFYS